MAFPIEARVKELQSILKKCKNKNLELNDISDIGDLAGFRIIVLFRSDIERVSQILHENFEIFKEEDAHNRLSENEFGYSSVHFDATLKESWCSIPTFRDFNDLKMEIQLRTASQHIWATSSHTLQYKKEEQIPMELRRVVNRAAALLELVDIEFERVLIERENYVSKVPKIDENGPLNIETLKITLDKILPAEHKRLDEDYSEILNELLYFNIDTANKLELLWDRNKTYVLKIDKEIVDLKRTGYAFRTPDDPDFRKNVYFAHSGLIREAMQTEFGKERYAEMVFQLEDDY